jgi:putative transposase
VVSFKGKHFLKDVILLVVRWYLTYSLSYRDIEEMMLERETKVDHSTLNRWVIEYALLLENEFRKNHKKKTGSSWRMDETYIKIQGVWNYLYRAVDKEGDTIDFMLSKHRDEASAKAFFTKAIGSSGLPEKVTIDKSGANKAGIDSINLQLIVLALSGWVLSQIKSL